MATSQIQIGNKMKKLSEFVSRNPFNKFWGWFGDNFCQSLFYSYLLHKYENYFFIFDSNKFFAGLNINLFEMSENHDHYNEISNQIKECIDKGVMLIVIPIFINGMNVSEPQNGHFNTLIYRDDGTNKTIEHFEPHGPMFMDGRSTGFVIINQISLFVNLLQTKIQSVVKIHRPNFVCPRPIGIQAYGDWSKDNGGYCGAWVLFFTELVLKHPELSSRQIMESILIEMDNQTFKGFFVRNVIRGYVDVIHNKLDEFLQFFNFDSLLPQDIEPWIRNPNSPEHIKFTKTFKTFVAVQQYLFRHNDYVQLKRQYMKKLKKKEIDRNEYQIFLNVLRGFRFLRSGKVISSDSDSDSPFQFIGEIPPPSQYIPIQPVFADQPRYLRNNRNVPPLQQQELLPQQQELLLPPPPPQQELPLPPPPQQEFSPPLQPNQYGGRKKPRRKTKKRPKKSNKSKRNHS